MPTQLTPQQRLEKAVRKIMDHSRYHALHGIIMLGKRTITDDPRVQTACTNGKDEQYARSFVERLTDAELRFLILHEVYHKMYNHLHTLQPLWKKAPDLTNIATDMAINTALVEDNKTDAFATMTGPLEKGCYDKKYLGWDSVSIFRDLMKNSSGGRPTNGGQSGGQGDGQGDGQGFDQHDWEDAQAMDPEEAKQLAREISEAVRQGVLVAGKLGTGGARGVEEILEPQQDWRDVLREFVQTTCSGSDYSTWTRPNRRYIGAGIYMPSGVSETIGEIIGAPDMSGSIGGREVQRMLSEMKSIAETVKPEAVRLLYWDTEICADERYERDELDTMIATTKPAGGGGTMVECVPEYMRKHQIKAQCAIVFTDGYLGGTWGDWPCPVLWVLVDNKSARPPFGSVVHVSTTDL
jgi:predicted metal-dependent peptidase